VFDCGKISESLDWCCDADMFRKPVVELVKFDHALHLNVRCAGDEAAEPCVSSSAWRACIYAYAS
jgi:hypothetical protein